MKFTKYIALTLVAIPMAAHADNYSDVLSEIVSRSVAMRAANAAADAEKSENHTGLNLANPEVEFSYQWGQPEFEAYDKKTIDVSQSFDFATLSGAKKRVAAARDAAAECTVSATRRDVTADVDALMTDIVYRGRMEAYYDSTLSLLHRMYEAAERSHKAGDISLIDLNSIRMEVNNISTEAKLNAIERRADLKALAVLAGGSAIDWEGKEYMAYTLPPDFNSWVSETRSSAPEVSSARAQAAVAEREISLRKSEGLPTFSLGYTSELCRYANYHGVAVGVELPLWSNSGRVKAAKAARTAAELAITDAEQQFTLRQRELYDKAVALQILDKESRELRDECDIRVGLNKMFGSGEMSVHDYISQLLPLLELDKKVIEAEYAAQQSLAAFRAYR